MGRPTVGSLFSGIGGIDLGLERAGFEVRWQVEWDEWCQRVLAKHWPDVPRYGDITAVDWSRVERVDVLAGGFPCQPFSLAGQRRGKADERWLWPSFAAAVRALRPRLVLVENVPGLLAGHGGMGSVLGDLAALGYDAEWDCIPAAAVGAPHLRYRVWIVAYPHQDELRDEPAGLPRRDRASVFGDDGSFWQVADAAGHRLGAAGSPDGDAGDAGLGGEPSLADPDREGLADLQGRGTLTEGSWDGAAVGSGGSIDVADAASERLARPRQSLQSIHPAPSRAGQAGEPWDGGWWRTEPDVGRVAARLPVGLDGLGGGLDGHAGCLAKARTAGVPGTERLRALREFLGSPTASPGPSRCALCGHPLSALPCRGTCPPWYLGAGVEADEHMRCLREGIYSVLSPESSQDLLARVPQGAWAAGGEQAVARRVDRLRGLGNAVVPQVVEVIGRQLLAAIESVA